MKKIVLTGGPSIGKTTIIEILSSMGYKIIPESARIIIEEEKIKDSDILPWKDIKKFQEKVAQNQIRLEEENKHDLVFMDRSIIDGIGYCLLGKIDPPEIIYKIAKNRYDKIFVLEPLNIFEKDGIRFETMSQAEEVHNLIIQAYKDLDYDLTFVPKLAPKERVEFILKNI